jgi:hypothetical protein
MPRRPANSDPGLSRVGVGHHFARTATTLWCRSNCVIGFTFAAHRQVGDRRYRAVTAERGRQHRDVDRGGNVFPLGARIAVAVVAIVTVFARAAGPRFAIIGAWCSLFAGTLFFTRTIIIAWSRVTLGARLLIAIAILVLVATLITAIVPVLLFTALELAALLFTAIIALRATRFGEIAIAIFAVLIVGVVALLILVAVIIILIIAPLAALLFEARAGFGDDAEIMIGELEIIFGHHAIARHLGVTRERFILFEHLRRIATRAIIDAVALFWTAAAIPLLALSTPAATATRLLTIIEQNQSLYSGC